MTFPNVFGVGVEKCGTTLLNSILSRHPDVLTPKKKELFFFNTHYDKGLDWYLSWYQLDNAPRHICDITPSYFRNRQTLQRIKQHSPDARVVVVLRHPVERSMSHYVHRIRHIALNLEGYGSTFWDEFEGGTAKGLLFPLYFRYFAVLYDLFPPQNVLVLIYENDIRNLQVGARKLFDFLDVSPLELEESGDRKMNRGYMPHFLFGGSDGLEINCGGRFYQVPNRTLLFCHAKGNRVWEDVDDAVARRNLDGAERWTRFVSAADSETLFNSFYRDDCEKLASAFKLDINPWLQFKDLDYESAPIAEEYALPSE